MLPHAIHSQSSAYVRGRVALRACLQFVFAKHVEPARRSTSPRLQKRVLLACLLMMAGPGAVGTSQATAHATRKAHHSVHLHWNTPTQLGEAVTGYNIYRSDDGGKTCRKLNRMPVAKTEYNDRAVRRGVSYIYVVKSVDNKGAESGPSNKIRMRVP